MNAVTPGRLMTTTERVTVAAPSKLTARIDSLAPKRLAFIAEAVGGSSHASATRFSARVMFGFDR